LLFSKYFFLAALHPTLQSHGHMPPQSQRNQNVLETDNDAVTILVKSFSKGSEPAQSRAHAGSSCCKHLLGPSLSAPEHGDGQRQRCRSLGGRTQGDDSSATQAACSPTEPNAQPEFTQGREQRNRKQQGTGGARTKPQAPVPRDNVKWPLQAQHC